MAEISKGRLIQVKNGKKVELPTLEVAEPAFCTDTFEFYIGSDAGNKRVMMADEPITIANATTTKDGLMSKADKSKLNGITASANFVEVVNVLTDTSATKALSANQGKLLNDEINKIKSALVTQVKAKDSTSTVTTASTWDTVISEFARVVKL